jgi:formylglycine-generating enzyme required for sulfatase activity
MEVPVSPANTRAGQTRRRASHRESAFAALLSGLPIAALGLVLAASALQASCSGGTDAGDVTDAADTQSDAAGVDSPSDDSDMDRTDGMSYGDGYGKPDAHAPTVCTPRSQRCSGSSVEICGPSGQWGSPVTCDPTTPVCLNGACQAASEGGEASTPASCQLGGGGMSNCGAGGEGVESCCTSLEVPGGTYSRSYANSGSGPTGEAHPATVSGFRLDKYLVTVGRFRQFVKAWDRGMGYAPPVGSGKHAYLNGGRGLVNAADREGGVTYEPGWVASDHTTIAPTDANLACSYAYSTWTNTPDSRERLPITCVNWQEAYAFCIWDGGFLPSEAEWEYAAAGGALQKQYPWGSAAPGAQSLYMIYGNGGAGSIRDCYYPSGSLEACTGVANIASVGTPSLGAGEWGQFDLLGDVEEWMLDWSAPYVDPCVDCGYLTPTPSGWVVRGGSFSPDSTVLSPPARNNAVVSSPAQSFRTPYLGFRCARAP